MSGGVNIAFAADATSFLKGAGNVENALDKVSNSLDGIDGKPLERELAKTMEGVASDSKDAADKLETKFSDAFNAVKKDAKSAGDVVERETKGGTDKAGEAVGEFKNEAAQNFSEVASSFQGDMSSAADGVQGILGGLAGSLPGPVGIISGILAGIGGAMFASIQASAANTKQTISDMYDDLLASGLRYLSQEYKQGEIDKIIKGEAGAVTSLTDAQDLARKSGQELGTVLAGLTGSAAEQARVTDAFATKTSDLQGAIDKARKSGTLTTAMFDEYEAKLNNVRRDQGHWNDLLASTASNLDSAQSKVSAARDATDKLSGAFQSTTDSAGRLSQGIEQIPSNVTVKFAVDDSAVRRWAANPVVINAVARVGRPQVI